MEIFYKILDDEGEGEIEIHVNVPAERVKEIALETLGGGIMITHKPTSGHTWFTIPTRAVRKSEHFGLFIANLGYAQYE